MVDIVKETLDNGEEYQFDIDLCNDVADDMLEELYEMEGEVENFDFTATVYSLFVSSVNILAESGWTTEDLIKDVIYHSTPAENNGTTH
jgi:hypothetical protein